MFGLYFCSVQPHLLRAYNITALKVAAAAAKPTGTKKKSKCSGDFCSRLEHVPLGYGMVPCVLRHARSSCGSCHSETMHHARVSTAVDCVASILDIARVFLSPLDVTVLERQMERGAVEMPAASAAASTDDLSFKLSFKSIALARDEERRCVLRRCPVCPPSPSAVSVLSSPPLPPCH